MSVTVHQRGSRTRSANKGSNDQRKKTQHRGCYTNAVDVTSQLHQQCYLRGSTHYRFDYNCLSTPFSVPEKIEMILLRGFLSSGTEGSGFELWLADRESLPAPTPKVALLILTGGAGGLSSGSPLSHILARCYGSRRAWGCTAVKDGQSGRQKGAQKAALTSTRHGAVITHTSKGRRQGRYARWHP